MKQDDTWGTILCTGNTSKPASKTNAGSRSGVAQKGEWAPSKKLDSEKDPTSGEY